MYYLNLFFIFSITGFFLESIVMKFIKSTYDSGFLFGPWTPVYGIGVLVIVFVYNLIKKYIKSEWIKPLLLFLFSALFLTIIEYIGGNLIELIFNKVYWNYETQKYNIGKYVSLESAGIWGVLSIIFIYLIKPIVDKIQKYIPKWVSYGLIVLFVLDLVITFVLKL